MKKIKRITSVVLALSLLMTSVFALGFKTYAETRYFESGVLNDGTYTAYYLIDKDERVLYLTGDGDNLASSPDYPNAESGPFAGRTDVTRIVIEEDVLRVGDYTFANMTSVDTLEIQSNLLTDASMSTKAMSGCTGLRSIQGDSTLLSTDVLVEIVKGAVNAFTGNWLSLAMNVINIGKEGFTSDNNLENEVIAALVDDYINTGETIYFGEISDATDAYNERISNPCYYEKSFHHNYTSRITKNPGCTTEGVRTYTCSNCGDSYPEPIEALGHTYEESVLYEPTCTKKGVMEYDCIVCGDLKLSPIDALGHTPETIPGVAPTCTATGLTQGKRCSVCGETLNQQETLPMVPHTYSYSYNADSDTYSGICDNCGGILSEFDNDISALVSAVTLGKGFNSADYTAQSYAAMYDSIVKYIDLTDSSSLAYPQYAVDAKTAEILTKISELAPYLEVSVTAGAGGSATAEYNGLQNPAPQIISPAFGEGVTLRAENAEGYTFKGWYEIKTKRYLSYDKVYTFTVSTNTYLKAVFLSNATSTLTITNDSGQIVEQISKPAEEWRNMSSVEDLLPSVPYKYGYTNGRWSYNQIAVLSELRAGRNATITPAYDSLGVTLPKQPVSPDGITPAVTLTYELVNTGEKYVGSYIMAADIPDASSVVEIGTCYYKGLASDFNPLSFNLTINNKTLVSKYEGINNEGIYITNINGLTSKYNWSARGYVTYYNSDGKLATAYSNQINVIDKAAV